METLSIYVLYNLHAIKIKGEIRKEG